MTIFRVRKDANYVVINRTSLNDQRLSWKAKGVLAYMLSMPDDWKFYITEICNHSKDGLDSLKAAIKELKQCGYLKKIPLKDDLGKITGWETEVYETPEVENPPSGKPTMWETHQLDNPPLLSIKELNTDLKINIDNTNSLREGQAPDVPDNQKLIAELVEHYRLQPHVKPLKGDYPFIGNLYNTNGYDQVYEAINTLGQKLILDPIDKPLLYLKGILNKNGFKGGNKVEVNRGIDGGLYEGKNFGF